MAGRHHSELADVDRFLDFSQVGNGDFFVNRFPCLKTTVGQTEHTRGWLVEMTILSSVSSKGLAHSVLCIQRSLSRFFPTLSPVCMIL